LTEWDAESGHHTPAKSRDQVEALMVEYMETQFAQGVAWFSVSRHMLGLRHGQPGARKWRQVWSDHKLKHLPAREVAKMAASALSSDVKSPLT
jgi:tRNA-dihydrouridine synthase A